MSVFLMTFIIALVFSAIGFKKYVWFISIGYGLSVAAIGVFLPLYFGAEDGMLEIRQDREYKDDPEYWAYKNKTPIMIPFVPLYSVKEHKWLVA